MFVIRIISERYDAERWVAKMDLDSEPFLRIIQLTRDRGMAQWFDEVSKCHIDVLAGAFKSQSIPARFEILEA